MKRNSTGWDGLLVLHSSGNVNRAGFEIGPTVSVDDRLFWINHTTAVKSAFTVTNADGWILVGAAKTTGTTTPRMHKYVYGTNTWTHSDADGAIADTVGTTDNVRIGDWQFTEYYAGDVAMAAVWKRALSDAEVEALAHSLTAWYASAPDAMWVLDQSDVTNIPDLTGNGANSNEVAGTTFSTSSPLGPSYGHGVLVPSSVLSSVGATVTPGVVSAVASMPAASVSGGATASPSAVAVAGAVPAASVRTGSTITPGVVAVVATVPAATAQGGAQVSPAAVAAVASAPAPALATGSVVTPAAVAVAAALPAAGASAGVTVAPAVITVGATARRPASRTATNAGLKIDPGDLVPPTLPITGMTGSDTVRNIVSPGTYSGYDFPGAVNIQSDGVIIENCRWLNSGDFWAVESYDHDLVIQDCEFETQVDRCITGSGFTARRLLFHNCGGDAFQIGDGTDALDTLIEDCTAYDWEPKLNAHVDGVHLHENGVHNLTIRGCWFELVDAPGYVNPGGDTGYTSPVFCQPTTPGSGDQGTIRVESNYLASEQGIFAIRFEDGVASRCVAVDNLLDAVPSGGEQIDASDPFEGALNVLADGSEYHHPLETEPLDPLPGGGQIPAPTVATGSSATPAAVAAVAALPSPAVATGSSVSPTAVAAGASLPAASVGAGAGISPAALGAVASMPAASVNTGSVVTAAAVAAGASLPAPTVQAGAGAAPAAIAASVAVPGPSLSTGSVVSAQTVAAAAGMPSPDVEAGGSATVAPGPIAAVVAVPAASVATGATVTPAVVAVATAVPGPVVSASATVSPAAVACAADLPAATVSAVVAVTPATVTTTVGMPAVSLSAGTTVVPGVIVLAVVLPAPAVTAAGQPVPRLAGSASTASLSGTAAAAGLGGSARVT